VIAVGDHAPDARIWLTPNEDAQLSELVEQGPYLLLFYVFDWSST
jgi:peroxiredoxin